MTNNKHAEAIKVLQDHIRMLDQLSTPNRNTVTQYSVDQNIAAAVKIHSAIHALQASVSASVPPPECQTDAEKKAFAFGWWKAIENVRKEQQAASVPKKMALGVGSGFVIGWNACCDAMLSAPAPQAPAPTVPDNMQDWSGMDGATAFHLIERHADNWADTAKMMGEWLAANQTAHQAPELPSRIALEKVARLEADGFTRYLATPLRRAATTDRAADYCMVGDGGDVRWCGSEPARELSDADIADIAEATDKEWHSDDIDDEWSHRFARAVLAARSAK
ncbi:MAG: hypothetical protein JJD98_00045 [Polaromonas sp.]|nr:hypothetical protein [Polaromonas sp.]